MATNKKNTSSNTKQISEDQVWSVLNFATSYYNSAMGNFKNTYTPELVNQKLQAITTNPLQATESSINIALADPKNHEQELIGYQEFFELTDMLTKRTLLYLGNLPAFDYTIWCTNNEDGKCYETDIYKKDYKKVKDFFSCFDVKQQFSYVFRQLIRQETGYYIFRKDGLKYQFQELPRTNCKITGKWDFGFLFDFNMQWFLTPGADIDMYPPVFKKKAMELYKPQGLYNPANPLDNRNSTFSFWVQTSPEEGFWAFKFNNDSNTNIPFLSGTFPDAVLRPLVRKLQTNQYIISAQKVMVGLIPFLKDVKSGSVSNQLAIDPDTLGMFLGLLKQGLGDAIKVGGVPFEDVKVLDFKPNDQNMLSAYNQNYSSTTGVTSRAIYADDRMSNAELDISKDIDTFMVNYIYPYFEDFLNYQINLLTKKYKFKCSLKGSNFKSDREKRLEQWHKNATVGIVLPQELAAIMEMNIWELEAQMDEAKSNKFTEKLITLMNLNTSKNGGVVGASKKDPIELSDSSERKLE